MQVCVYVGHLKLRNAQMYSAVRLENDMLLLILHTRLANGIVWCSPADADRAANVY